MNKMRHTSKKTSDSGRRNMNVLGLIVFFLVGLVFFKISSNLLYADSSFVKTVEKLRERMKSTTRPDDTEVNSEFTQNQESNDSLFIEDTSVTSNEKIDSEKTEFVDSELAYLELKKDFDNLEGVLQDFPLNGNDALAELNKISGDYRVDIFKDEFTLFLMKGETLIKRYYIGIGKNPDGGTKVREGDNRTPEGHFRFIRAEESQNWVFNGSKAYGPWFLRLDTGEFKGIGIHGTDSDDVIGTRCTRGCIRMYNDCITELKRILPANSEVNIFRSFVKNNKD